MSPGTPSDQAPFSEADIRALLELLVGTDLVELEVERDGLRVRIRRDPAHLSAQRAEPLSDAFVTRTLPVAASESYGVVASPWVGVFHASVRVGEQVEVGQPVGIVEALRMRHSVETDSPGVVEELLVRDGHAVEYGQPLVRLRDGSAT